MGNTKAYQCCLFAFSLIAVFAVGINGSVFADSTNHNSGNTQPTAPAASPDVPAQKAFKYQYLLDDTPAPTTSQPQAQPKPTDFDPDKYLKEKRALTNDKASAAQPKKLNLIPATEEEYQASLNSKPPVPQPTPIEKEFWQDEEFWKLIGILILGVGGVVLFSAILIFLIRWFKLIGLKRVVILTGCSVLAGMMFLAPEFRTREDFQQYLLKLGGVVIITGGLAFAIKSKPENMPERKDTETPDA